MISKPYNVVKMLPVVRESFHLYETIYSNIFSVEILAITFTTTSTTSMESSTGI
jgi:hypothetical protein